MKAGNWVINSLNEIFQVSEDNIYASSDFKQWIPEVGSWNWYGYELVQIIDVNDINKIKIVRQNGDGYEETQLNQLEPFLNELPTFAKETK